MDGGRRQKLDNHRRSQNKKPPHDFWKHTVPYWEREFCKVVGSMDWGRFLQMKKFMHLYTNVIEWNDFAGEEAFSNAKRRFWCKKNGYLCDIPLPDPDLYIDKIDWDSEINHELLRDLESTSEASDTEEGKGPAVHFDDSLMPNHQAITPSGWGDDDEKFDALAVQSLSNHGDHGWDDGPTFRPSYSNEVWKLGNGCLPGHPMWGGDWNNNLGWSYTNNYVNNVGTHRRDARGDMEHGRWNDSNVSVRNARAYESSYRTSRAQANEVWRNHMSRNSYGSHRRPPYSRRQSARDRRSTSRESDAIQITAEQTWKPE